MSNARRRDDWDRLSALLCLIRNVNRGPKDSPMSPAQFNPFAPPPRQKTFDELFPPNFIKTNQ